MNRTATLNGHTLLKLVFNGSEASLGMPPAIFALCACSWTGKPAASKDEARALHAAHQAAPVVGFAPGGFDLYHWGHEALLKRAAALCDRLVVGVASDRMLERAKGRRPIGSTAARRAALEAHGYETVVMRTDWASLHPTVGYSLLFKGDDWAGTTREIPAGVELVILPRTPDVSTTALREKIAA